MGGGERPLWHIVVSQHHQKAGGTHLSARFRSYCVVHGFSTVLPKRGALSFDHVETAAFGSKAEGLTELTTA